MPYVAPSTVTAGQTYTAAAHNIIVEDIIDHEARINAVEIPFRNILINGAMQFSQRNTSSMGLSNPSGYYTADRWLASSASAGSWTQEVAVDAPTGSGFRNSLKMTCEFSAASAAGTNLVISQKLEGQTLQMIRKGTSSAQQLTLSFWVKGNKTGTYIAELNDTDNNRAVSSSYTISAANTWERKTLTFPADTTGALDNDNAASLDVRFWLAAGTNFTSGTLATTWASVTNANRAVGQTRVGSAFNDYWAITGVQLELGTYATDYAFLPYDVELARCQRYYYKVIPTGGNSGEVGAGFNISTTQGTWFIPFPQEMRIAPTTIETTMSAPDYYVRYLTTSAACSAEPTFASSTRNGVRVVASRSGLTAGQGSMLVLDSFTPGFIAVSAEL